MFTRACAAIAGWLAVSVELVLRASFAAAYLVVALELTALPIPSEASTWARMKRSPRSGRGRTARIAPIGGYSALGVVFVTPLVWTMNPAGFALMLPLSAAPAFGLPPIAVVSVGLVITGTALGAAATLQLRRHRSAEDSLYTGGVFAYSRNPIVLSLHLTAAGFLVALPMLPALVAFPIYLLHLHRSIRIEERHLAARFGAAFDRYRRSVNRYFGVRGFTQQS